MSTPTTIPYTLHLGDCLDVLRTLPDCSVDSVVTDPPYGIRFMGKAWDGKDIEDRAAYRADKPSHCASAGPSGGHRSVAAEAGKYDLTPAGMRAFQAFTLEWATECLRVLKPGGHLLSFAAARTYHHMAVGIEMAGFEIRDQIMWVFGSGFPKSHNLKGDHDGWGTALKPAHEPICMARKPLVGTVLANVLEFGTGAINIDACRVEAPDGVPLFSSRGESMTNALGAGLNGSNRTGQVGNGRWPANLIHDGSPEVIAAFPDAPGQQGDLKGHSKDRVSTGIYGDMSAARDATARGDSGSAARFFKSTEGTDSEWLDNLSPALTAQNSLCLQGLADAIAQSDAVTSALPEGTALSVVKAPSTSVTPSESRLIATAVIEAIPRFVIACLLGKLHSVHILSQSPVKVVARQEPTGTTTITASHSLSDGSAESITFSITPRSSEAGAKDSKPLSARFIYCAKTSRRDRNEGLVDPGPQFKRGTTLRMVENTATKGNNHPTVKPTELMAYLLRLVTPPGGVTLDPFLGSGSTGKAAMQEGFQFIGVEMEAPYMAIADARIRHEYARVKTAAELADALILPAQADLFGMIA